MEKRSNLALFLLLSPLLLNKKSPIYFMNRKYRTDLATDETPHEEQKYLDKNSN